MDFEDGLLMALKLLLIFIITFLVVFITTVICNSYGYYEYKTIEGYYGEATHCYSSYGNLYCVDTDGSTISVIEFKKVK